MGSHEDTRFYQVEKLCLLETKVFLCLHLLIFWGGLYELVVWGWANSFTYLFVQKQVEGREALDFFSFKLSCVLASIRQKKKFNQSQNHPSVIIYKFEKETIELISDGEDESL